jgi:hypothetical protein
MTTRIFQIALVSKLDEKQAPWFNYQASGEVLAFTDDALGRRPSKRRPFAAKRG